MTYRLVYDLGENKFEELKIFEKLILEYKFHKYLRIERHEDVKSFFTGLTK